LGSIEFRISARAADPFRDDNEKSNDKARDALLILQKIDLVDIEGLANTEERDDDSEADCSFRSCDDHHEEHENLTRNLMPHMCKRHKREIDGVQHELNGHENGDDVAFDEKSSDANAEQYGSEDQVTDYGHHQESLRCDLIASTAQSAIEVRVIRPSMVIVVTIG
jgi:hypothetical protein